MSYFRPRKSEKPARGASAASRIQLRNCLEKGSGHSLPDSTQKLSRKRGRVISRKVCIINRLTLGVHSSARITERSDRDDFSKSFAIRKKLVDVTGIEPVTPCLQSTGTRSTSSVRFQQLLTFPTNRGICFSLKGNSNLLKSMHFCTLRTQHVSGKRCTVNPSQTEASNYRIGRGSVMH